mmetsp:Transcript_45449/g.135596  ORF Transcript_45449/g.135596 Transcript_45449/m.135596 type:complete len:213 (+) Transcript_45449:577-1215(+)
MRIGAMQHVADPASQRLARQHIDRQVVLSPHLGVAEEQLVNRKQCVVDLAERFRPPLARRQAVERLDHRHIVDQPGQHVRLDQWDHHRLIDCQPSHRITCIRRIQPGLQSAGQVRCDRFQINRSKLCQRLREAFVVQQREVVKRDESIAPGHIVGHGLAIVLVKFKKSWQRWKQAHFQSFNCQGAVEGQVADASSPRVNLVVHHCCMGGIHS